MAVHEASPKGGAFALWFLCGKIGKKALFFTEKYAKIYGERIGALYMDHNFSFLYTLNRLLRTINCFLN